MSTAIDFDPGSDAPLWDEIRRNVQQMAYMASTATDESVRQEAKAAHAKLKAVLDSEAERREKSLENMPGKIDSLADRLPEALQVASVIDLENECRTVLKAWHAGERRRQILESCSEQAVEKSMQAFCRGDRAEHLRVTALADAALRREYELRDSINWARHWEDMIELAGEIGVENFVEILTES